MKTNKGLTLIEILTIVITGTIAWLFTFVLVEKTSIDIRSIEQKKEDAYYACVQSSLDDTSDTQEIIAGCNQIK